MAEIIQPQSYWDSINPILNSGDIGVVRETGEQKRGDGSNRWSQLSYLVDMPRSIYDPDGISADAFDMDNMKGGSTYALVTISEKEVYSTIVSSEEIRQSQESTRQSQEAARNVYVAYNAATQYVVGNKVAYNGSSYRCIANCVNVLPTITSNWLLISSKGDPGTTAVVRQVTGTSTTDVMSQKAVTDEIAQLAGKLRANTTYKGVATPSTNPGTPDQNVFYLASTAGTYSNFGSIVIAENEAAILKYNGTWSKDSSGFATSEKVSQLERKLSDFYPESHRDTLYITDNNGYVVCKIDKNGVHATKINSLGILKNTWAGKVIATYGDSITAVNNGDFEYPYIVSGYNWGLEVAKFFSFGKNYGRGIGSTCFKYRDHGGQVAWVNTLTGNYVDRNDSYNYDNYEGNVTIPDGCTPIRGDGSSWLRLTSMFPASIRDTIDVVLVMFHNDFHYDMDTDVEWIPNDVTDPEWAASEQYSALGGDYNIASVKGGIASVVMKLQALMPQATVILMTPIGGVYSSAGEDSGDFNNTETAKMKKLADCVLDVAQRMSAPTINVYGNCGINTLNRTTYIADTIHPYTIAGRKKVGRAVASGLMNQISL